MGEVDRNKAVVRAFIEAINARDWSRVARLVVPEFTRLSHAGGMPGVSSRDDLLRFLRGEFETFPDAQESIADILAEGDRVAVRHSFRGTQSGPMGPHPPSGRVMAADYLAIYRLANGLIAESWAEWDNLSGLTQLGHHRHAEPDAAELGPTGVAMNVIEHNRAAWNRESTQGSEWSTPVTSEVIAAAREGVWTVILTPTRKVPASWFGDLRGKNVLCLASGGGQQAPVLAAAGANVVSFDLSEEQLNKDREVAERENLSLQCVRGDMADLDRLRDEAFHLIYHPVSNVFVPDVMPVWRECYRVLKPEGRLLAGMMNPCFFLFDHDEARQSGVLAAKYPLPYSEPGSLSGDAKHRWEMSKSPAQFSHTLESLIGGQTAAGFAIVAFYEDYWTDEATPLNRFFPAALATLAVKATSG